MFVFRSSSLGLTKREIGILVVEGTLAVNVGAKVSIFNRVIGEDAKRLRERLLPFPSKLVLPWLAPHGLTRLNLPKEKSLVNVVLVKMILKRMNWHEP